MFVEVPRSHRVRHRHTLGRTPLNEWPARKRGHYVHKKKRKKEKKGNKVGIWALNYQRENETEIFREFNLNLNSNSVCSLASKLLSTHNFEHEIWHR